MIKVKLRVYATLIKILGNRIIDVELDNDPTVKALLEKTSLSKIVLENGKVKEMYKIMVNGRDIEFLNGLATKLQEGDIVDIFPPLAGGLTSVGRWSFITVSTITN